MKVFVSFSHQDEEWKQRFEKILKPAVRDQTELIWWSDEKVEVSDDWHAKIQSALTDADLYVCLVSPDFLASEYISKDELPVIMQRRERQLADIACLYLRTSHANHNDYAIEFEQSDGCRLRKKLTTYQALNSPDQPVAGIDGDEAQNKALHQAADRLLDLINRHRRKPRKSIEPQNRFDLTITITRHSDSINCNYYGSTEFIRDRRGDVNAFDEALKQWEIGKSQLRKTDFTDSLFALLFGKGTDDCSQEILKKVADATDSDRPSKFAFRIRLLIDNAEIATLPWSYTSYHGEPLRDCHWLFEHRVSMPALGHNLESSYSEAHPLPTIILNPAAQEFAKQAGSGMVQALNQPLKKMGKPPPKNFQSWQQVQQDSSDIAGQLVYFVGSASEDNDKTYLHFFQDGREHRVTLAELLKISGRWSRIVYLNLLVEKSLDYRKLADQLDEKIPLILLQQGHPDSIIDMERSAVDWLNRWMQSGGNPVAAFHYTDHWQSCAIGAYRAFETSRLIPATTTQKDLAILLLDRHTQRANISAELRKTITGKQHRVLFAPVCAAPGNQIQRFPDQLLSTLKSGEGVSDLAVIRDIQLEWPQKSAFDVENLERLVKKRLDSEPDRDLQKIIFDRKPNTPPDKTAVMFLHWPVLDSYPDDKELSAIEFFLTGRLAPECPPNMRILIIMLMELDRKSQQKLAQYSEDLTLNHPNQNFEVVDVDPLDNVSKKDLAKYLGRADDTRCPPEMIGPITNMIIEKTNGDFSRTVELLEDGIRHGWYNLHDELKALNR